MEILVAFYKVKAVRGTFAFRRIYQDLRYWLVGEGYANSENTPGFPEIYVWHEDTQKSGKETWIWWRPYQRVGTFTSEAFIRRELRLNYHVYKYRDDKIMVEGKKETVQVGTFELFVEAVLVFQFPSWEKGGPFMQSLFEFFWKRIYWRSIEGHKSEVLSDAYKLQGYLKRILEMKTWTPPEREHYPKYGITDTEF